MTLPRRALFRAAALAAAAFGAHTATAPSPTTPPTPAPRRSPRRGPDWAALARDLDGRVIRPGDPDHEEARRLFQPRFDRVSPAAVAYPAHAADVATTIAFARRSGVPITARSGGHGYAGWSTGPGLVVDTGALARIEVSGAGARASARIGAGARLGEVNRLLAARGVGVPTGLCPSVGIAGLALGGGLGLSSRAHGATSDAVTAIEVVAADGVVRTVSAQRDPDLFWALRGAGGGNFGIVTEFTLGAHPVGRTGMVEAHWAAADTPALLAGWQRWLAALPDPVWSQVEFTVSSDDPAGAPGAPSVRVVSLEGRAEADRQVDRLVAAVGRGERDRWAVEREYGELTRVMGGCGDLTPEQCRLPGRLPGHDPRGRLGRDSYAARSDFWDAGALTPGAVDAVLAALARYRGAVPAGCFGVVQFDGVCGGALNRTAPGATAFVHRSHAFLAQYLSYWPAGGDEGTGVPRRHREWLDGLWRDVRPWASGAAYQNYVDPALTDWRRACHGANLGRLEEVRGRWDPERLFRFPQAI
ncbi:FAD-binding oxidoreductase [Streptomyces sp. BI20]|uniref:FAD-binding oxidoreductase n=1 Tax=Streptomyces sp. BI20 TaxID=3403460 RepID=UPI003C7578CC